MEPERKVHNMELKKLVSFLAVLAVLLAVAAVIAYPRQEVKRVGMVIGLKPDKITEYEALHADSYAGVRDLLQKHNIRNFSIFLKEFDDGNQYLFAYYEYVGDDYEGDLVRLDAEERNKAWLAVTDAMQTPFRGEKSWSIMKEVFYND
jgi:L-rhamnose mutarotase